MKKRNDVALRFTDLDKFVGIYPDYATISGVTERIWHVISFDEDGTWESASWYKTEKEAKKHRSLIFSKHRKLFKKNSRSKK